MAFNKEKVMDAARKFVDKGQIDKAVKEYLRIVSEDPKDVRVWLKIGDLYAKKGAKQDATDTYLKVARFYHEQGFVDKAIAVYEQIRKLDPRLVEVIMKLAELYRQRGKLAEAMQYYESVAAHFHREGNTKDALGTVVQLVDLDPENIATRIKLAELYSKEGLVEEAVTQFTYACEQLRRQNRQDDFIKVAERLLWHKPDNHALGRELAGLYLRRNDPRRALQKLQACFKADPRDPETLGLLALAFQALDQKAKTVSVLKELARIHVENKARDKASEVYRKILEIVPGDADAAQFLGGSATPPAAAQATPTPPPARAGTQVPPPRPVTGAAPPPTPGRPGTPLPAAVRAASDARFNLTSDMPEVKASARMTGSMPLIDEQSLSGVDFALPEYDDGDFSADLEAQPDPRRASAAGERHADEISKILAETDVYVKYGLHHKAVDHLRRVFTLDGENVEAHERLKEILVSQGREQEAEVELLKLAELVAPSDPDRAEQYLQELLAMNGTHTGAFELARRFRLRVARMSSVSSEVEYDAGGPAGGVAEVDPELDDLALAAPPRGRNAIAVQARRDSVDDFDPDDLIGDPDLAHGSPAPGRPPGPPMRESFDEFAPSPSHATRQVPPDQISALARGAMGVDDLDEAPLEQAPPNPWERSSSGTGFDGAAAYESQHGHVDALEAQLDDAALGADIDQGVADELGDHEDLPFDPADARAFDAGVGGVAGAPGAAAFAAADESDDFGDLRAASHHADSTAITPPMDEGRSDPAARAESVLEEDLEEADFYAGQGMYDEALEALGALLERYPNHPLILNKVRDVQALQHGEQPLDTPAAGNHSSVGVAPAAGDGTDALDLEELEEVGDDDLDVVEEHVPAAKPGKRKPTVMLEKPVDEGDAETHYDLGLAYKEMGLYDEAIKAFDKVLRSGDREVQVRIMLGMCMREQGNPSEAIQQFKQGLHATPSDRERLSLYYEIAITYEAIGDDGEALYYLDGLVKRDPGFADAAQRASALRGRGGRPTPTNTEEL